MKKIILASLIALTALSLHAMDAPEEQPFDTQLTLLQEIYKARRAKQFIEAFMKDDLDQAECIISGGNIDLDDFHGENHTLLQLCAGQAAFKQCGFLIYHGAQVNISNAFGNTALHFAAGNKHVDICKLLLRNGARIDIINVEKETPLHSAVRWPKISPHTAGDFQDKSALFPREASLSREICEHIINRQKRINDSLVGALLFFYRLKNEKDAPGAVKAVGTLLYNQRASLLLPHLEHGQYISLIKLLNMKDSSNNRPYDYYHINCLNPDLIYSFKTKNTAGKNQEIDTTESNCIMQ